MVISEWGELVGIRLFGESVPTGEMDDITSELRVRSS